MTEDGILSGWLANRTGDVYAAQIWQQRALVAEAKLREVTMIRTWQNEDGKSFVFTEDLLWAIDPEIAEKVYPRE